jgi:hypothetical protein
MTVSPVEPPAIPKESQQQASEVRNGPVEEELQMVLNYYGTHSGEKGGTKEK